MNNKSTHLQWRTAKHVLGSCSRTLLALTFLFSGFVKAVDPLGTVYKIEDYLELGFGQILQWAMPLSGTLAILLITTELLLGVTMLFNVRSRWTSWITLAFYLLMTPITLYIAIANPVTDCGCFGDALVISNWATFGKNVILLALAIVFVLCRKAIPQLFNGWAELCIALLALGTTAGIMGYSYTHLPIMDFRPYKVGNNIRELMENNVPPVVKTYCLFEKDGEQKEFIYHERPDLNGDSTWTFISQETRTLSEGKEPTITDFYLENGDGDDVTYDILMDPEPITLIVMYDLNKRNRKQTERAVKLYKERIENGEQCYFLTGSSTDAIETFAQDNEIDTDAFLFNDATPIKTIVRANPGVVVLQEGTVISKQNMRQVQLKD